MEAVGCGNPRLGVSLGPWEHIDRRSFPYRFYRIRQGSIPEKAFTSSQTRFSEQICKNKVNTKFTTLRSDLEV